jgi:LuxR family maltose regulon positive regulatory protein
MSKITRPILTGVLPRKRLFGLLDRMRKHPVIWVSGPPGCGKTTLVASYLEARKLPCLWYQIDQGDTDPATFFFYLGQAAKKASPRFRKSLPLLTPEYLQDIPTFTFRYFENLYTRLIPSHPPLQNAIPPYPPLSKGGLRGNLKKEDEGGFIIVFDNYHELPPNSPLHEIILNGLSRIPEGVIVILISRTEPPPALIRLQANNLMGTLGWDELRLNPEESRSIIRLKSRQKLSKETIQHLHNITDGWAAGLILILESMKRGIEPQRLGKLTPDEIIDYFGRELFDKTDKEIQEFFLKTAFLPRMTAKMAEELTNLPFADRILSTLSRNNYFTERKFHIEPIYQYHPLYRDFLLLRARETFSQDTLLTLPRRAARLLEEDGQTEAAVSLLTDINDWDSLTHLITKHAPQMVAQGRVRPLEDWLSSLPMEILENNPWLLYWMGSCHLPFDPLSARSNYEKAFEKFKVEENPAGIFLAWSGVVESIWFDLSDFKLFDKWISVLGGLMHDFEEFPSREIEARVAYSMFTALLIRQPQHPEIETWSERMLASLEYYTNVSAKMIALFRQVLYRMFTGDYVKLTLATDSLRKFAQSRDASPLARLTTKFAETIHYRFTGSHERCLNAISDGLEISRRTGIHMLDRMFLFHGTLSALSVNDGGKVKELLEMLEKSSTHSKPWDTSFYHILKTRVASFQGNPDEAAAHAEAALKISVNVGSPLSLFMCHLVKCHAVHRLNKDREAAKHLNQALHLASMIKSKNAKFYALFAKALLALDQGDREACLLSLREALAIGEEGKYFDTYIDQPSAMVMLCSKGLEAEIEVEYVQELIRIRNLVPEKPPLHLENWPWPLKIYTLGRFELLKDGKPIHFSRKAQQRPLSLLKVLIAFGGKEVREDQIEDALWPEADGDAGYRSFVTNLRRLRLLLGYEKAIQLKEGRLTLDNRYCWVDGWAFEHLFEESKVKQKEWHMDDAIQLTGKAIELYKGAFLRRESEQPWMIPLRERLRSKFLEGVENLGRSWRESGHWGKALDCYLRGLEIDDLAEELYQGLMVCYLNLGQKSKALSVYNRCKRTLSSVLGIEPSAKIQAIYNSAK